MLWTLMRKDLVQHARPLLTFAAAALILPPVFAILSKSEQDGSGYAGIVFGYLGVGAPMLFGQWFIGQEKLKGTFKLLRLLPVSGIKIILTKYLSASILCLLLINMVLLVEPVICRLIGPVIAIPAAPLILWTNIAAMFLVAVGMALFTALDTRIATQAIIWTICGFMVSIGLAGNYLHGRRVDAFAGRVSFVISDLRLALFIGLILAGIALVMVWFAARLFDRMEWSQLEEG